MADAREQIEAGRTALGIEFGSTRIKACLVSSADPATVLAVGTFDWENSLDGKLWTYPIAEVWEGLQGAYADLAHNVETTHGVTLTTIGAIGISAMMHGYLAFDKNDELLVPFRTWRNTNTGVAAAELSELFGVNIPLRWSIAHLHQAIVDSEPHVPTIDFVTTLAGYVHWQLTGQKVLGVGDASGMFPIAASGDSYDAQLVAQYNELAGDRLPAASLTDLFPKVLGAGQAAGALTRDGARLLDPTGALQAGIPLCPAEGDAGTGMVATNSVEPRTGNVSAGTSIFAMAVLEHPLENQHHELDLVTTPAGDPVAMVHCNNGASELDAWVRLFIRFAEAAGSPVTPDAAFETLFREALGGAADAGGLLAYNHLAGEPVAGMEEGRPVFVRTTGSDFTLANTMRSHIYGVFGTLALGMRVLDSEGVKLDRMYAHGGLFRTAGVAQRFLAGALGTSVAVAETASEGGAWGIAVLAAYLDSGAGEPLSEYLAGSVFAGAPVTVADPVKDDVEGFASYLDHYHNGLAVVAAAVESV
ncbi:MAG: xylulokinase [Ancrocorticia sp.]|uniref:xylulokinase n=1 Tax=Ancrocorticia sp. TaxID=2593684 RepID=UPI003F916613